MMGPSQHTVQPSELLFGSHNIGTIFHRYMTALIPVLGPSSGLDSRPVESNTVGYPSALTGAPPCEDQIPPVVSSGNVFRPHTSMVYRNIVGPIKFENVPTGSSRTREPPPESGSGHFPYHEAYPMFVYNLCCFS